MAEGLVMGMIIIMCGVFGGLWRGFCRMAGISQRTNDLVLLAWIIFCVVLAVFPH
jgi:hypothetical protein